MATRQRDQCVECGEMARLRHNLCPACYRKRPGHVPYVGNWRIGKAWPISKIDPRGGGRRPAALRGSDQGLDW